MKRVDVVVAGAGPAGSVAALRLARAGHRVILIERSTLPRWKVCGACLGPAAMSTLSSVGLEGRVRDAGAVPLHTLRLMAGGRAAEIRLQGHRALSRWTLDASLASAACEAGVELLDATTVLSATPGDDGVTVEIRGPEGSCAVEAAVVIDAAGLTATFRSAGHDRVASGSRLGLGAVFAESTDGASTGGVPTGVLSMAVGGGGYVGFVRTEEGRLNVAAAVDAGLLSDEGPEGAVRRILEEAGCHRILPPGPPLRGWKGTPALTRRPEAAGASRLFRVGDAAGYVEPFTGEGMGWALSGGARVAEVAHRGILDWDDDLVGRWASMHRRTVARRQRICRLLSVALRVPALVGLSVRTLTRAPFLADPLVRATGAWAS